MPIICGLLVTYRPEYSPAWGGQAGYTLLRLNPLTPTHTRKLLEDWLGADPALLPIMRRLVERTQGNPFFLEESVHTLIETGVLVGDPGAYYLPTPVDHWPVPTTVRAVLAARLDRLPTEAKRLLQTAAVISPEVALPLLQATAESSQAVLYASLATLQRTEFLYEMHLFPERAYTFTHALTHEVVYDTLLPGRRRTLHAHLVEAVDGLYADRLAEQIDQLAHHAIRGKVWGKATVYCRQAGEKALARSAYREAVIFFEPALGALRHLPECHDHDTHVQAIDLRLALRTALYPLGERERILISLQDAAALAEILDDQHRLG